MWHDYPGEWFEQDASGPEEEARRVETFKSLLSSDVALLLIDAQRLLDNVGCEERYLKSLIANFRNSLLAMKDDLLGGGARLVQFPRIWVMALSKADLLPEMNVAKFRDLMVYHVAEELEDLRQELCEMIEAEEAFSLGEDFLLLSSAKFEKDQIDLTRRIGIELILPIACMMPFERHAKWRKNFELPQKVASALLDNAKPIASVLMTKVASKAGVVGTVISLLASTGVVGDLIDEASELVGDRLRAVLEDSRQRGDAMQAALAELIIKLEEGEKSQVLLQSFR